MGIAQILGDIAGTVTGLKYGEKIRTDKLKFQTMMPLILDHAFNPETNVTDPQAEFMLQEVLKTLDKDSAKSFQQQLINLNAQKALAKAREPGTVPPVPQPPVDPLEQGMQPPPQENNLLWGDPGLPQPPTSVPLAHTLPAPPMGGGAPPPPTSAPMPAQLIAMSQAGASGFGPSAAPKPALTGWAALAQRAPSKLEMAKRDEPYVAYLDQAQQKRIKDADALVGQLYGDDLDAAQRAVLVNAMVGDKAVSLPGGSSTSMGSSVGVPGVVKGSALTAAGWTEDSAGAPIDEAGQYSIARNNKTDKITFAMPTATQASQNVQTRAWVKDAESSTGFTMVMYDQRGSVVSIKRDLIPPASLLPTITESSQFVQQTDGTFKEYRTPTVRTPQIPGGPAPSLPPQSPEGLTPPPSEQPIASESKPEQPQQQAKQTGQVVGGVAMTPQERLVVTNAISGLDALATAEKMIKDDPNVIKWAAVPGSPFARKYAAAIKEVVDVITRLRTGAALNMQEESFYKSQAPGLMDLLTDPDAIPYKISILRKLFTGLSTRKAAILTAPPTGSGKVKLQSPNGQIKEVDASEVDHYTSKGAKVVE